MKLIIAGGRDIHIQPEFIDSYLASIGLKADVEEIVSGGAEGVDWAGEEYSIEYLNKEAKVFQADWSKGHIAGPERNAKMAEYAGALLLIWSGRSPGSANMKKQMLSLKKPIYEIIIKDEQ